jgi:diguanylate cyclase (GGDEF)-like protein
VDAVSQIATHVSMMVAIGLAFGCIVMLAPEWGMPWQWAVGFAVMPQVMVAGALAEYLDSDPLRVGCNAIGVVGPALIVDGLRRFMGLPTHRWIWGVVILVVSAATWVAVEATPRVAARVEVFVVFALGFVATLGYHVWRLPTSEHAVTRRVAVLALVATLVSKGLLAVGGGVEARPGDGLVEIFGATIFATFLAVCILLMLAERMAAKIRRDAETDTLTGLATRRVFNRELDQELARWARYRRPVALILFDIDKFKQINDGHGHDVGDRALQAVAACGRGVVRPTDLFCRLGGDEFAVVLRETPLADAVAVARRLREEMRAVALPAATGAIGFTGSFGVACAESPDETAEALIKRADEAAYEVKRAGRDGVAARHLTAPFPLPAADPRALGGDAMTASGLADD